MATASSEFTAEFALSPVSEYAASSMAARYYYRTCSIRDLIRADFIFDGANFKYLDICYSQFLPEFFGRPELCPICKTSGSIRVDPGLRLVCTIRGRIRAQFGANPHPLVTADMG